MGQGTWQSCEVLGTGPWHCRFSTGRDASEQSRAGGEEQSQAQVKNKNLLRFPCYSGPGALQPRGSRGSRQSGEGRRGRLILLLFPAVRIPVETRAARRWRRPTRCPFVWCVASLLACQNDELATIISPRLASPRLARNVKRGGALPGDCWRRQKGAGGRFEVCGDSDRRQTTTSLWVFYSRR